jgi:hypothetical protein
VDEGYEVLVLETSEDFAHFLDYFQLLVVLEDQIFADQDNVLGCLLHYPKWVIFLHVDNRVCVIIDDDLLHLLGYRKIIKQLEREIFKR